MPFKDRKRASIVMSHAKAFLQARKKAAGKEDPERWTRPELVTEIRRLINQDELPDDPPGRWGRLLDITDGEEAKKDLTIFVDHLEKKLKEIEDKTAVLEYSD